ncbi:hypothetical protein K443DRAFT_685185 [Laccaria amethystina LaAM-08-1]|uniref:Uncharacterized protein n=1 Tax=Laccaria amethystina LaAM-08-1 TaxID=1095629 RepID=A0A0C9WP55_9AGAR|nr:hypothetical protein K443DRAFT_685185 [Laccaria amethystina LaAM-08-1]
MSPEAETMLVNHLAMWIYGLWTTDTISFKNPRSRMICTMGPSFNLYYLSHTNRSFQDVLRSPGSNSVWRAADYNIIESQ